MFSHLVRVASVLAIALLLVSRPAAAQTPRPLPDADVVTPEGGLVKLAAMQQDGQWLVLYISESSAPSARLLEALAEWRLEASLTRVVVVVAGVADAQPLASEWAERLPGVRWASDPSGSIARGAGLRGTPTVIGARDGQMAWILAGVLNDPGMIRDVVRGWVSAP